MKTKRILSALIASLLLVALCACAPAASSASDASMHIDTVFFPMLDGSTACLPLMARVKSEVCGLPLSQAEEKISCSGTSQSWLALANEDSDILFVYEAAEQTKTDLDAIDTKLDITPIVRDALVFICNADNPVDDISSEQLRDVYSGRITNWSELGGNNEEIIAFQRNETSAGQSLFVKLVMQGESPMRPPTELMLDQRDGIVNSLANYNNASNALGYSVYYYASYMYSQPDIKFLSVDGVMPSEETIADGSYPLLN